MNASPVPARGPSPLKTNVLIGVLCLIWGSTWIVVKKSTDDLPPFTSAGVRMALAALVMALAAFALRNRESGEKPKLWLSTTMGLGNFAITYGIVYWASTILPSGLVALLWAVFPMMMAVAGHFFLEGERLRARQWLGFALGFAGVAVLKGDIDAFTSADSEISSALVALIVLISPLAACIATTVIKQHGANVSSNLLNRDGLIVASIPLLALAFLFERDAQPQWTGFALFSIGYLAIMGTCVTFGIYYWLLRYAPAYKLSLIAYITPAIAMALGTLIGNEPLGPRTLTGAAFILGGVVLVVTKGRRR